MNPEIKTRWLEALRSGRYQQTRKMLESDGKFCCLGVLCDIALKGGIVTRFTEDDRVIYRSSKDKYDYSYVCLPSDLADWAGLERTNPSAPLAYVPSNNAELVDGTSDGMITLAELNDDGNCTFNQIADLIEEAL